MILVGILVGVFAHQASQTIALREWSRTHGPSHAVLKSILKEEHGFYEVKDSSWFQRLYRVFPTHADAPHSYWISQNGIWVATFLDIEKVGYPKFFSLWNLEKKHSKQNKKIIRSTLPKSWRPLQLGWTGLEELLEEIRKSDSTLPTIQTNHKEPKKKVARPYVDPRAIIY